MNYPDTSFLVSLYLNDANGDAATEYISENMGALLYTPLARLEMSNALRLSQFRGILSATQVRSIFRDVSEDISNGFLKEAPFAWSDVLLEADRLSAKHTPKMGNRTLDILHVAAAEVLGAKTFLSFDLRQRALAEKVGLAVFPKIS